MLCVNSSPPLWILASVLVSDVGLQWMVHLNIWRWKEKNLVPIKLTLKMQDSYSALPPPLPHQYSWEYTTILLSLKPKAKIQLASAGTELDPNNVECYTKQTRKEAVRVSLGMVSDHWKSAFQCPHFEDYINIQANRTVRRSRKIRAGVQTVLSVYRWDVPLMLECVGTTLAINTGGQTRPKAPFESHGTSQRKRGLAYREYEGECNPTPVLSKAWLRRGHYC